MSRPPGCLAVIAVSSLVLTHAQAQQLCAPRWTPGLFAEIPGVSAQVNLGVIHDDGSGPALFVGGMFLYAGAEQVNRIARWDGQRWSGLGTGVDGTISALVVFDVGGGITGSWVDSLHVHDDGTGVALYVGSTIGLTGGVTLGSLDRWNGQSWSSLTGSFAGFGTVLGMQTYDDGNGAGPALFVGGSFANAGGVLSHNLARWGRPYPIPGDFDHDCAVGLSDLVLLLASYGRCAGDDGFFAPADFDANGCIGLPDLATFLSHVGATP